MKKRNNNPSHSISALREQLRRQSVELAEQITRSVSRLTSADALPCEEYSEEIRYEHSLAQRLFYVQRCRGALERCIACGAAKLRYSWSDGTVTETAFYKVDPKRVRVDGLLTKAKKERASFRRTLFFRFG